MGSKAFLFLGLFVAIFAMISSEVGARELAETCKFICSFYLSNYLNYVHIYIRLCTTKGCNAIDGVIPFLTRGIRFEPWINGYETILGRERSPVHT